MTGFVDIHSHILAGIDDGPGDEQTSLEMARAAVGSGIRTLVATPHLREDFSEVVLEEIAPRTEALQTLLDEQSIALTLVPGAEASLSWALDAGEVELRLASFGQQGRDLLIETPWLIMAGLPTMLSSLRSRGYRITLAHPERSAEFQREPAALEALVDQGVLLQVNASSLLAGGRKSPLRSLAERLCTEGLASVVAGDAHRPAQWRPVTALSLAAERLTELVGPDRAQWLVQEAPEAIVAGRPLDDGPPPEGARRRSRWMRLGRG